MFLEGLYGVLESQLSVEFSAFSQLEVKILTHFITVGKLFRS